MQESAFLAFYQYWKQERYNQRPLRNMKKAQKPSKTKSSYLIFFKQKTLRMKRLLENVTTLRLLLFSMTIVRRVTEIRALAVTQKVVKIIAKTEGNLFLSPFVRLNDMGS